MSRIRWGLVGCGRIAHTFAKDIAGVSQASLVAVAARELDRSRAFAAEYPGCRAHGSYDALFNDKDIDAVYIATPGWGRGLIDPGAGCASMLAL